MRYVRPSLLDTFFFSIFCGIVLCGTVALSEEGYHQHEAHQHGVGELGVVQEGNEFSITLRAPASDLVGFEHSAASKEEREAVSKLEKLLEDPEKLFTFQKTARCKKEHHKLSHGLRGEEAGAQHEGEVSDDHDHDHDHDHEHGAISHSEVDVAYRFSCENAKVLQAIQVNLFREFSTLRHIEASVITPSFQGRQHLTPSSAMITLSR